MTRFRQIYNIWGVFSGPSPATGYHYERYDEQGINDPQLGIFDFNRLKQIDRVNSFVYSVNIERENFTQLGVRGLVDRPIINRPPIQVNLNYYINGVRNESRLGLVANYNDYSGAPILGSSVCCFDNFTGRNTDYRNLFVAVMPNNENLDNNISDQFNHSLVDPKDLFVFGFGNCYMNSYRVTASVGAIPETSIGFICDNIEGYASGSGAHIPSVLPKTGNTINDVYFTIPRLESSTNPSVLLPGDITFKLGYLTGTIINESTDLLFGVNSSGMPIQSFEISTNLEREDLRGMGYVLPVDRRLNFPILVQTNISTIVGNNYSGSLVDIFKQNISNDLLINMYNPGCEDLTSKIIGIQYRIKNAKLQNISSNYNLQNKLITTFSFVSEIDINNSDKGMFISGSWNAPFPIFPYFFLILENNKTGLLLKDDGSPIIIGQVPF